MKFGSMLACLVAAAAALTATALPADAAGPKPISKCSKSGFNGHGQEVKQNSYLTKNLTCEKGFVVMAGATLDMRGHKLTGVPDPFGCASGCPDDPLFQETGHAGIVLVDGRLKNGRLDNWVSGVRIPSADPTSGKTRSIASITVTNSDSGVFAYDNDDTVAVSRSVFSRNRVGVSAENGGSYTIDRSTFVGNADAGADTLLSGGLAVTNSVFSRNGDAGISSVYPNGDTVLKRNTFTSNGEDGAYVLSAGDPAQVEITARKNVAVENGGYGLALYGTVNDLGGNKANGNGAEPQCVGVVCR